MPAPLRIRIRDARYPRLVFSGGPHGEHGIDLLSSTPERARVHARGYAETAGADPIRFGDRAEAAARAWHEGRAA